MDLTKLDAEVCCFCHLGLATSTHKAYKAAINRFSLFCAKYGFNDPFPVNEFLLCRFVASLAQEGLSPNAIKTYLAGIRHAQILKGLPEPCQSDAMPWLKLLQSRVAWDKVVQGEPLIRECLPITLPLLLGMLYYWTTITIPPGNHIAISFNFAMLVATTCFFGFFYSGKMTVQLRTVFDEYIHLALEDVTADEAPSPSAIQIHLECSKCDQLERSINVFLGRTGSPACPVTETVHFVSL